jgi:hypothetical protein
MNRLERKRNIKQLKNFNWLSAIFLLLFLIGFIAGFIAMFTIIPDDLSKLFRITYVVVLAIILISSLIFSGLSIIRDRKIKLYEECVKFWRERHVANLILNHLQMGDLKYVKPHDLKKARKLYSDFNWHTIELKMFIHGLIIASLLISDDEEQHNSGMKRIIEIKGILDNNDF